MPEQDEGQDRDEGGVWAYRRILGRHRPSPPPEPDESFDLSTKELWRQISFLAREPGYCFAGNNYFAKRLGASHHEVESCLRWLHRKGLVRITGRDVERHIHPCELSGVSRAMLR